MSSPVSKTKPRARILHAEDQALVAEAIQLLLNQSGYEVEWARNGAEALDKLRAAPGRFDLLLTDGNMPNLSGRQLIEELRATNFPGKIVVLSGMVTDETESIYEGLGVNAVIRKPFQIRELLEAVDSALES